jgi:hypothetical protein
MTSHAQTGAPTSTLAIAGLLERLQAFLHKRAPHFAGEAGLIASARALSERYTADVEDRALAVDAAASLAYLAHFGPRAVVAVARGLRALPATGPAATLGAWVVDVGAGSGASALPWLAAGARRITLVEQSTSALALAVDLLRFCYPHAVIDVVAADAHTASAVSGASHVAAAFSLGEWSATAAAPDAVNAWLLRLAPNATTGLFVDAGDRPRARRLQTLRDAWVKSGDIVVWGPCPHTDPCPALVRARDWCHDVVDKDLPPELAAFSRAVGRDDVRMATSWLAFSHRRVAHDVTVGDGAPVVVIGTPQKDKGRVRLPVCGPGGLRFVQALKRHRAAFAAVLELPRGARLPAFGITTDTAHIEDDAALVRSGRLPSATSLPKASS